MTFGKIYKKTRIWIILAVAACLPLIITNNYWLHILNLGGIFAICSLSLNLLTGCTGLFSVGHIAYYGIGAYTAAVLATRFHVPFLISLLCSGLLAMVFGILLGMPALRLKGLYLAISTLAFGEIAYKVFLNWEAVTNGSRGIRGIKAPVLFGIDFKTYQTYYYLVLIFLIITVVLIRNIIHSRVGRALLSIRESEIAASAMGVDTVRYKIIAFATSSFFAGISGCLYAYEVHFISPESFVSQESITVLAMMVVGGIGSISGSIAGAFVLIMIPEVLRSVGDIRLVLYGAAIVAIIIFAPKGLGGLIDWLDQVLSGKRVRKVSTEDK